MTALSHLALGLAFALGLAGCTTRFKLDPARTPDLVAPYSERQRCIIYYRGTGYAIRPEQAPELRVIARRPSCQPARGELAPGGAAPATPASVPVTESFSAPLGDVRTEGDVLYFPNTRAVRTSEIQRAELVLSGDAPVALPPSVKDEPASKSPQDKPLSSRYNFIGGQFGGSGIVQGVYRRRIYGPLFFDIGLLVVPAPVVHGSAGLVVDVPTSLRWSLYAGGGGGFWAVFAGGGDGCSRDTQSGDPEPGDAAGGGADDCSVSSDGPVTYWYGRVGAAYRLGPQLRDQIGIDVGFWSGAQTTTVSDGPDTVDHFVWPMVGLSMMHAL
jgi:hypothetical protein